MSTLRVTNLKGGSAGSAPNLPDGGVVTGVITATSFKGSGSNLTFSGFNAGGSLSATTGTFTGNVSIGGTLTYEDVTNIDSVGIVTARQGIKVTAGGIEVAAGNIHVGQGGAGSNNGELKLQAGAATGNDIIAFLNEAGSTRGNITYDTDNNFLMINVNAGEKLRVTSDGKLGINVTNPQTKLHLNGNYSENIVAVSGTAVDCSTGNYFTKTITGATTFTFTNVPAGVAYAFTFEVTLNGSNAITWPATVKWPADTAPAITDGKTQVFIFLTDDGGTRWRGSSLVDYTN